MKRYVLVYVVNNFDSLVMIRKNRPEWQAGNLNFPGGHIEEGETAFEAANRELLEETGLTTGNMERVGIISAGGIVYVFQAHNPEGDPVQKTDEEIEFHQFNDLQFRDDLVDRNIVLMHTLITAGFRDWTITHHELEYQVNIPYHSPVAP